MTSSFREASDALRSMYEVIDLFGAAMVLVTRTGDVLHSSRAAREQIGEELRVEDRRLTSRNAAISGTVDRFMRSLDGHDASLPGRAVSIPRKGAGPLFISVVPLSGPARRALEPAHAILIFVDPGQTNLPSVSRLQSAFSLTPTEAKLAIRIATGDSLTIAARACRLSYESARSSLKAIFHKTDTHRQAELAILINRLAVVPDWVDWDLGKWQVGRAESTSMVTFVHGRSAGRAQVPFGLAPAAE